MPAKKTTPKQSLADSFKNTLTHSVKNLMSMASKKNTGKSANKLNAPQPKASAKKKAVSAQSAAASTKKVAMKSKPAKAASHKKVVVSQKISAKAPAGKAGTHHQNHHDSKDSKAAKGGSPAAAPAAKAHSAPHSSGSATPQKKTMAPNAKLAAPKLTKTKLPVTTLAGYGRGQSASHMGMDDAVCREVACENLSTTGGYCRLHYIKNWKKIKRKEVILKEKKLNQYIEELVSKYPDKYLEAIRQDLCSDKDFAKVITDLDLDESLDDFDVDADSEEIIDSIKRDFDDESDAF